MYYTVWVEEKDKRFSKSGVRQHTTKITSKEKADALVEKLRTEFKKQAWAEKEQR